MRLRDDLLKFKVDFCSDGYTISKLDRIEKEDHIGVSLFAPSPIFLEQIEY